MSRSSSWHSWYCCNVCFQTIQKDHQIHLMDVHPSILTFIPCEHYWQNPVAVCSSGDAGNRSESISLWLHYDWLSVCVLTHEATRHSLTSHSLIFLPPKFTVHTPWCVVVRERCESISGCVPASNWWCVSNSLLLMMRTQLRPTSHENMASSYFT